MFFQSSVLSKCYATKIAGEGSLVSVASHMFSQCLLLKVKDAKYIKIQMQELKEIRFKLKILLLNATLKKKNTIMVINKTLCLNNKSANKSIQISL
jgi:hypothetical protein